MANIFAKQNTSGFKDATDWRAHHNTAILRPRTGRGESIGTLIQAWAAYAGDYEALYVDCRLGEDYVLGEAWKEAGCAIRTLLNGSCGRLDCGTLDSFILDTMREHGVDVEGL